MDSQKQTKANNVVTLQDHIDAMGCNTINEVIEKISQKDFGATMAAESWEAIRELFGDADGQIVYDALVSGEIPYVSCEWINKLNDATDAKD